MIANRSAHSGKSQIIAMTAHQLKSKIENIIFDFGGVLVDWNPRYLYADYFQTEDDMEFFLQNICTGQWNEEQDRGRPLAEATDLLVKQFPDHEMLIRLFYGRWEMMLGGEISGTVELLYALKKKFDLYGLTNWSAETISIAYERFQFFNALDGIVVSGVEKIIKPDKRLFQILLQRYDLVAAKSLFIDDNINNIIAANELGFQTIHFQNPAQLRMALSEMGLL